VSARADTFASQLRHFARAVDIVDDDTFDQVRRLVYKYVKNELGAEYFELMREQPIEREPALKMFWSSEDKDHFWRVRGADGGYSNAVTRAFGSEQPLWLVGADHKALRDTDRLEDLWSHADDLPGQHQPAVDQPIRTIVAVPLRFRTSLGIYYFESCSYIAVTDAAKTELLLLGSALAILLDLYEMKRTQSKMTASAISDLQDMLQAAKFPRLAKPHFFLASSTRADGQVTAVISEVLHEFSDGLEFTDWSKMSDTGNISAQIVREIRRSRFGICYLSEPTTGDPIEGPAYLDNPNVVFEAGMLHALTSSSAPGDEGEPAGWIPVREAASPPAPFDFAAERTVYVPRFKDGALNEPRLREELTGRVRRLLRAE
jgi:hypothetical protein